MDNKNDYERILFYPHEGGIEEIDVMEISYKQLPFQESDSLDLSKLEKKVNK